jgi:hypothetical protein
MKKNTLFKGVLPKKIDEYQNQPKQLYDLNTYKPLTHFNSEKNLPFFIAFFKGSRCNKIYSFQRI